MKKVMCAAVVLLSCLTASRSFAETIEFDPTKVLAPKESEAMKKFDYAAAARKLKKLAAAGDVSAKVELGYLYFEGKGVEKNLPEAARLFREAADKGNANAQSNLGKLYQSGAGVKKDPAEAVKWYRQAAEQGQADAQASLGMALSLGEGVPQDKVEGLKWILIAAERKQQLASMIRNQMIRGVTAEQALLADKQAKEWQAKKGK